MIYYYTTIQIIKLKLLNSFTSSSLIDFQVLPAPPGLSLDPNCTARPTSMLQVGLWAQIWSHLSWQVCFLTLALSSQPTWSSAWSFLWVASSDLQVLPPGYSCQIFCAPFFKVAQPISCFTLEISLAPQSPYNYLPFVLLLGFEAIRVSLRLDYYEL